MSEKDRSLRPELENRVNGWRDGHACGAISVFEWCIREVENMSSGGHVTSDAIGRRFEKELDRRFPMPDARRSK